MVNKGTILLRVKDLKQSRVVRTVDALGTGQVGPLVAKLPPDQFAGS